MTENEISDKILQYLFDQDRTVFREDIEKHLVTPNVITALNTLVRGELVEKVHPNKAYYKITGKGQSVIKNSLSYSQSLEEGKEEQQERVELIREQRKDIPRNYRYRNLAILLGTISALIAFATYLTKC